MDFNKYNEQARFIIVPKQICDTCQHPSGRKFSLSTLPGPSDRHRSNIIPTGPELEILKTVLTDSKKVASELDNEISRLQEIIDILKQQRDALNNFEAQERSILSPIRKLPTEILRQIFRHSWIPDRYLRCDDRTAFPRIVIQVSSYWRSVALSCGFMWSKVSAAGYDEKYGLKYGETIQNCVIRSNEMPLSIMLDKTCTPDALGNDCVLALGRCAYRWEDISIANTVLPEAIFSAIPIGSTLDYLTSLDLHLDSNLTIFPAPKLTVLSVNGYELHDDNWKVTLTSAESLVTVNIRNLNIPLSTFVGLPWSQITRFQAFNILYNVHSGEFCTMLSRMPNLTDLSLDDATDIDGNGSVTLTHLETLDLALEEDMNILDIITAPNLKTLELMDEVNFASLVAFTERSKFSLRELRIFGPRTELAVSETDALWVSTEFENITRFTWYRPRTDRVGEFFRGDRVFPKLEKLNVIGIDVNYYTGIVTEIISTIEARISTPLEETSDHYLKDVVITFYGEIDAENLSRFQAFVHSETVKSSQVRIEIIHGNGNINNHND